ncbi:hypothetical protein EVAR_60616_1 [Eumeta japonica]|uniref:Uncharacterized protein n=1 Tax=Eumeta variegata TaxID=151549 RepID=A0A4C1YF05_EUMVA|nr:hypothetical protein EVAR_60616_1 [Eumeta japonica]
MLYTRPLRDGTQEYYDSQQIDQRGLDPQDMQFVVAKLLVKGLDRTGNHFINGPTQQLSKDERASKFIEVMTLREIPVCGRNEMQHRFLL